MSEGKDGRKVKISFLTPGGRAKPLAERTLAEVRWALARRSFASADEINAYLERAMAGEEELVRPEELAPEEKAQMLVYDAWEAKDGKKRAELARQALELWPECADAYVVLAEEEAKSPKEAKELYERAVKAARAHLGEEAFRKDAGRFWKDLPTRPYMRARAGLTETAAAGEEVLVCNWLRGGNAFRTYWFGMG